MFLVANYSRAQIGALISCLRIRSQPFLNVAFSTLSLLESWTPTDLLLAPRLSCHWTLLSSAIEFLCLTSITRATSNPKNPVIKVTRYSFSGSISPKFEDKLRRHKQRFGKTATTVVSDKGENLLWHRSCHSNEMTLLPILLAAVFLGTGNCSSKIAHGCLFLQ